MMPVNILNCAGRALMRLFSRPMRPILWRVIAITALCLVACWVLFRHLFALFLMPIIVGFLGPIPFALGWLSFMILLSFSLGLSFLFYFSLAPLTVFIGSFFADDVMEVVEQNDYPLLPRGQAMSGSESFAFSLRFLAVSILGNFVALILCFIPPLHMFSFYIVNGYILGRAYFILAAQRFHPYQAARELCNENLGTIFLSGLIISFMSSIPFLNLIAPLFGACFMAYIYKNITAARRQLKKTV